MKPLLTALAAFLPAAALAHGGHAPLPQAAHELSHGLPYLALGVLVAGGLALIYRGRS
ncbi:MAG: hypothetical protein OIF40_03810 [Mangrovicoccus sp.]|nr:hypothetical protein [Mangrovicoccus sp.]